MKIFITGSTTGLGFLAGKKLIEDGHDVYLHARNQEKAVKLKQDLPQVKGIAVGDLSRQEDVKSIAKQVNAWGKFNAIIHNAGVYLVSPELTYSVNIEAPYLLTTLIKKPERLIYVSSGMHRGARLDINNLESNLDYSGSKLAVTLLMKKVAREFPNIATNAVDPGWVPTRMGGSSANDDLTAGYMSQVWLAESDDELAHKSGNYYYHRKLERYDNRADDEKLQDELVTKLEELTKVEFG
ncbi:NAD(P)-dependent dehydrogenase (short-subunit alcohol dehydrogenase family) [Lactobacillus colini]|uniref:NAD(P)-dependent dehydrogenase (Short-subunit alcohol dehydrogenase family) n=1 Tax=Lactobacillus colini TaxID=1819254 RepID=A0ABS4MH42_9LACO|nr:SDR family NAD(P)-dependent oxidoreductase [Lactobacillus colini]MBP2058654.1 NAD(P)-dependent dehydrogenase (short-subunit alcohol dehydrogenase family) [Lactobacillus colini]